MQLTLLHPYFIMTSSNGNIFRVTGPLCGEFIGPGEFPTQRPVTRSFDVFFICAWINGWINSREAGDLRRPRGHYGANVMWSLHLPYYISNCKYKRYPKHSIVTNGNGAWIWTYLKYKVAALRAHTLKGINIKAVDTYSWYLFISLKIEYLIQIYTNYHWIGITSDE